MTSSVLDPAGDPAAADVLAEAEAHRVGLTGYCYRMLGSSFEAEDAVQETMLRAWKAQDSFEGRSSRKSWLYRIATNVCFDMLTARQRRARPMDLGPCSQALDHHAPPTVESMWVEPSVDARTLPGVLDPAEAALAKESVRLAFVAALQKLPPRQRAVLLLREVLRWSAAEVAELLGTSVASVNSALQRARATLDTSPAIEAETYEPTDAAQRELLEKYLDAFTRYDIDGLVKLLHSDATMCMPPYPMWLSGPEQVLAWMTGPGKRCEGSRMVPVSANGMPAFAQWRRTEDGTSYHPWSIHVLEIKDGVIVGLNYFLDVERLFPLYGLPAHPDDLPVPA
ncbi:sigma-70 family RNA polymerase sigma factor [Sporichthya polymorpha]|uniref:sigma-70 family RNA polymerase sigma factor n=1 Tax=Sporichthya polymorpha TaxID=35751 RepID=UPI0003777981|nr:sigma-70 family RNA polymerase sigma factor [Sporichthya polymorpha]